jgi:hypothetical protein
MVKPEENLIEEVPELWRIFPTESRGGTAEADTFRRRCSGVADLNNIIHDWEKNFLGSCAWRDLKKLLPQEQHDRWESLEGSRVPSGSQIMPKYVLLLFPMMLFILGPP